MRSDRNNKQQEHSKENSFVTDENLGARTTADNTSKV